MPNTHKIPDNNLVVYSTSGGFGFYGLFLGQLDTADMKWVLIYNFVSGETDRVQLDLMLPCNADNYSQMCAGEMWFGLKVRTADSEVKIVLDGRMRGKNCELLLTPDTSERSSDWVPVKEVSAVGHINVKVPK